MLNGDGWLLCPSCGDHYTHHDRVIVFERKEDSACSPVEIALPDGASFGGTGWGEVDEEVMPNNPSMRKGGVVVTGVCEGCSARWALRIAQTKGQTVVDLVPEREA